MDARTLRLGTRRSLMATTQAGQVAQMITDRTGVRVELAGFTTRGDSSQENLAQIGGTGVFVSALRQRLLAGEVDLAVHSLKDLPTGESAGITLAAVPPRDDPRDALAARDGLKLADLPARARVGTGSPRRVAQLLAIRPDLACVPIRGNADTRLRKVADGEADAVVLAYAGLARIARLDAVTQVFEPDDMLPAPGQGALAVECRADDAQMCELLAAIDDPASRAAVTAERSVLAALEAGCSAPVGAHAALHRPRYRPPQPEAVEERQETCREDARREIRIEDNETLHLSAAVLATDGRGAVRLSGSGPIADADRLGRELAAGLLARGAGEHMPVPPARTSNGEHAV
jgi:hydroxymethylbilane synthase